MTTATQTPDAYPEQFQRLADAGPAWLRDLRRRGFERFTALGFPTTRHEDWRFTNLQPLARTAFSFGDGGAAVSDADLQRFSFGGISAARLTFVDGRYRPDLSLVRNLPRGLRVMSLAEAIDADDPVVHAHLGKYAEIQDEAFTALNTAFIEDGAFVHAAAGIIVEDPVHVLMISTGSDEPRISHPRHLIVAEGGSVVTVIEHYVSLAGGVGFSNAVTEVAADAGSDVKHYLLERENESSFNIQTLAFRQDKDSRFESHAVLLGGAMVRNNVRAELAGTGANSLINGLYLPHGSQHMDNHMRVAHAAPHCDSRQFYKGILDGKSSAVFSGRIVVRPGAQKTDAKQTNRTLLLSDEATIDAKPQLEIYADDVKCTHGATTGELDPDALFYFQSRGIPTDLARGLLIYAFAHEALERMTVAPIRRRLEQLLVERLPQGRLLAQMI